MLQRDCMLLNASEKFLLWSHKNGIVSDLVTLSQTQCPSIIGYVLPTYRLPCMHESTLCTIMCTVDKFTKIGFLGAGQGKCATQAGPSPLGPFLNLTF